MLHKFVVAALLAGAATSGLADGLVTDGLVTNGLVSDATRGYSISDAIAGPFIPGDPCKCATVKGIIDTVPPNPIKDATGPGTGDG